MAALLQSTISSLKLFILLHKQTINWVITYPSLHSYLCKYWMPPNRSVCGWLFKIHRYFLRFPWRKFAIAIPCAVFCALNFDEIFRKYDVIAKMTWLQKSVIISKNAIVCINHHQFDKFLWTLRISFALFCILSHHVFVIFT